VKKGTTMKAALQRISKGTLREKIQIVKSEEDHPRNRNSWEDHRLK